MYVPTMLYAWGIEVYIFEGPQLLTVRTQCIRHGPLVPPFTL